MKISIIGCGLIGRKRAIALEKDDILVSCCDINEDIGKKFSSDFNCKYYKSYKKLLKNSDSDVIIVSVINKYSKKIVLECLNHDKHVLLEKPMGINEKESIIMHKKSILKNKILKIGFNHRFHPSLLKAKEVVDKGIIGDILFIHGIYGHGGREGMEKEWRSSKKLCGGGELLDQGVHMIDLTNMFVDDITKVYGNISTKFWNIEVEDNAFFHLKTKNGIDIQIHVSWNIWKNTFIYEIYGNKGYIKINGLGRWYGTETLELGIRKSNDVPDIELFEYKTDIDNSWNLEWENFKHSINNNIQPFGDSKDGVKANRIIDAIYKSSKKNKIINIK